MSVWRSLSGQVPAVIPIYPNAVVTPEMAAAMYAATGQDGGMNGMGRLGRLGCTDPMICAGSAWAGAPLRGADVDYGIVGLNGVGDFVDASFPVPQNPIVPGLAGMRGMSNGILNGLAGLRGLGAIDTSSLANFMTSVESGSSTLLGVTLPNYVWLGGGALLIAALMKHRR